MRSAEVSPSSCSKITMISWKPSEISDIRTRLGMTLSFRSEILVVRLSTWRIANSPKPAVIRTHIAKPAIIRREIVQKVEFIVFVFLSFGCFG